MYYLPSWISNIKNIIEDNMKKDKIVKEPKKLNMEEVQMPGECTMWTMTNKSHFGVVLLNLQNIPLNENDVVLCRSLESERYLEGYKPKGKKVRKPFHNSKTLLVKVGPERDKPINIKIFSNGAVSLTGCKTIAECYIVLNKLYNIFKSNPTFVKNINELTINNIEISLINCGFVIVVDKNNNIINKKRSDIESIKEKNTVIGHIDSNLYNQLGNINFADIKKKYPDKVYDVFWIKRDDLLKLLKGTFINNKQIHCRFVKKDHAGVLIEYPIIDDNNDYQKLTIIVFASGRINIAGGAGKSAKISTKNIKEAYEYITKVLYDNEKLIRINRDFAKLTIALK
jgi:TATA-box binding protein (TBP) (component of TFIID and TFIIIB)